MMATGFSIEVDPPREKTNDISGIQSSPNGISGMQGSPNAISGVQSSTTNDISESDQITAALWDDMQFQHEIYQTYLAYLEINLRNVYSIEAKLKLMRKEPWEESSRYKIWSNSNQCYLEASLRMPQETLGMTPCSTPERSVVTPDPQGPYDPTDPPMDTEPNMGTLDPTDPILGSASPVASRQLELGYSWRYKDES